MQLSEKKLVILTGIIAIVISLVLAGLGIFIFQKGLKVVRDQITATNSELQQIDGQITERKKLEEEVIALRQGKADIEKLLPRKEDVAYERVVKTFRDMAREAEVDFDSASVTKEVTSGPPGQQAVPAGFERIGYSLKLQGEFFELIKFISLIENHERFFRVSSFNFIPGDTKTPPIRHTMDIQVTTYIYKGS